MIGGDMARNRVKMKGRHITDYRYGSKIMIYLNFAHLP